MKVIMTLTLALLAFNAFAINHTRTWHSRGKTLKFAGYTTSKGGFLSKQSAVNSALALAEELQSGDFSKAAKAVMRNARPLWDSDDKCQSNSSNLRILEKEMAKGNFEVIRIQIGSYYSGSGEEVFSYGMRFYAPCVKKERD